MTGQRMATPAARQVWQDAREAFRNDLLVRLRGLFDGPAMDDGSLAELQANPRHVFGLMAALGAAVRSQIESVPTAYEDEEESEDKEADEDEPADLDEARIRTTSAHRELVLRTFAVVEHMRCSSSRSEIPEYLMAISALVEAGHEFLDSVDSASEILRRLADDAQNVVQDLITEAAARKDQKPPQQEET